MKKKRNGKSKLALLALLSFFVLLILGELVIAAINFALADTALAGYSYTLVIIPVISIILTGAIVLTTNYTDRKTAVLIDSLKRVADGDYSAVIDADGKGAFSEIYANFNKMTAELNSVKSMRDDFVHTLSHELKTPLCSIQGFASLLLEGNATEEESRQYLHIIAEEADRLRRLTEGILTISRLENMQVAGEKSEFKLHSQIRDCAIMYQNDWSKKNIEVDLELDEITINGDGDMIKQLWINLISNAVKFTPENGKIEISLKRGNGCAVAKIKDNGAGIDEGETEKIFEKYYRSPSAKKTEGNGLGLAICKRICALCGGSVSCKSKKGNGTEFTVTLPL